MNNILLSVIVPIYNTGAYLDKCIESLVNQTLDNIEIILIDDGSEDDSLSICNKYLTKYDNIRVYSKKYSGVGATRNYGISLARGRYIGFVDSDDYIDKNMYKYLIESALNNEYEVSMCGYEEVHNNTTIDKCDIDLSWRVLSNKNQIMKEYLMLKITTFVWDKIYKKDFLLKYKVRFEEGCYYEDINMVLKSLHYCNKIAINETKYYKYIQREGSIMHSRTEKHLNDYICQISNFYKFIYENYNTDDMLIEVRNSKFRLTYNMLNMLKDMKQEYKMGKYFRKLTKPIVIFGASGAGEIIQHYCELFGIKILYFCDNSNIKWGKHINGIEIISPEKLLKIGTNFCNIFIASMYYKEIYNQLLDYKLEKHIIDLKVF
jgi:glycosyltransferase involved in cell wall biosynthesis